MKENGLLKLIRDWVAKQGDEAYQRRRREREAVMNEVIIEHEKQRREGKKDE